MEKLHLDSDKCIGCGLCVNLNEEYFDFNDEGISIVKNENVNEEDKPSLLDTIESCPTGAITINEK